MNDEDRSSGNEDCWELANKLLETGVVSETCAKYEWIGDVKGGAMSFKFVICKDF